jgi:ferrous iron transport protein A
MQQTVLNLKPLAQMPLGSRARIAEIRGGRELTRRLLALGLRVGSEVRIEHHRGRGLVLSTGSTRVALGGGIVEKLIVADLGEPGVERPDGPRMRGTTPESAPTTAPGDRAPDQLLEDPED